MGMLVSTWGRGRQLGSGKVMALMVRAVCCRAAFINPGAGEKAELPAGL